MSFSLFLGSSPTRANDPVVLGIICGGREFLLNGLKMVFSQRNQSNGDKTGFFPVLTVIKIITESRWSSAIYVKSGSARQLRENNFSGPLQTPINNKPLHELDAIFYFKLRRAARGADNAALFHCSCWNERLIAGGSAPSLSARSCTHLSSSRASRAGCRHCAG